MQMAAILNLIKMIIPKNKVGAWILGLLAAGLALGLGINNTDLKDAFCAAPVVQLPVLAEPQVVQPVEEKK